MAKLLSNPEDPQHIHAICGLMSLIHYIYRFFLICRGVPHAGFGQSLAPDLLSLAILALPNLTSYIFRHVRIKKGNDPYSITRKYRGHSVVFAGKVWVYMVLLVYARNFQNGYLQYDSFYRHALEFGTMLGMKSVTQQYDPKQASSVRSFYSQRPGMAFAAGFAQFLVRASMFCGPKHPTNNNMLSALVIGMFVIQINAFNMTLRKKRIIGPKATAGFYAILLAGGACAIAAVNRVQRQRTPVGMFDQRYKPVYLATIAYAGRRLGLDRFSCWIVALSFISLAAQEFGLFQPPLAFLE